MNADRRVVLIRAVISRLKPSEFPHGGWARQMGRDPR
jgi:hypothetical protein